MTNTFRTFRSFPMLTSLTLGLCLSVSACDKGDDAKPATSADAPAAASGDKAAAEGGEAAPAKTVTPEIQAEADAALSDDLASLDPKVAKAVQIARDIEADPGAADAILVKHQLDREGLDALMYEIARSPDLNKSYRDARMAT